GWNVSPSRVKKGMFVMTRDLEGSRGEIKMLDLPVRRVRVFPVLGCHRPRRRTIQYSRGSSD
ncbi:MAG TPA: hypothetical protein VK577_27310, partial [Bradyrhizobium sp.]|nr:hypothetical protein [Bradyrhizobium sp.]